MRPLSMSYQEIDFFVQNVMQRCPGRWRQAKALAEWFHSLRHCTLLLSTLTFVDKVPLLNDRI